MSGRGGAGSQGCATAACSCASPLRSCCRPAAVCRAVLPAAHSPAACPPMPPALSPALTCSARWHMASVGSETDVHNLHLHGNTFL